MSKLSICYILHVIIDNAQALPFIISARYFDKCLILENTKTKRHVSYGYFFNQVVIFKNNLNKFEVLTIVENQL